MLLSMIQEETTKIIKSSAEHKEEFKQTIETLLETNLQEIFQTILDEAIWVLIKIAIALVCYFICKFIITRIIKLLDKSMKFHQVDSSLRSFIDSLIRVLLYTILVLFLVQILGFNTTSLVAIFASASLAIGMALSGTMQNFAGGVMILLLRPYKVGDVVTISGYTGVIKAIKLFTTVIQTPDNHTIYIPNHSISTTVIQNISGAGTRRISFEVGISYGDNFEEAKKIILQIISEDSRILTDIQPGIYLTNLNSSSVDITVRVWVNSADFWDVQCDLRAKIYEALPKHGFSFPFPQMDVHMIKEK